MHHFAIAVCAVIVATVVVGGTALTTIPAEAAKTPSIQFSGAPCQEDARRATIMSRLYRGTVIATLPLEE